jgi:hypothetical protein
MYLSLCLIVKNENSYLKEWLDYHILLGVEHFWIYDNESNIPVSKSLDTYIKLGWVTVNNIKGQSKQLFAYDHCIQTYGNQSKWIGFIDTDEFIVLREGTNLKEYLASFESYAGLAISSLFFGFGGNKTRPIGGQIAGYQLRTPEQFSQNRLIKSIVQPEKVLFPISPHSFLFSEGNYCVNEDRLRVDAQRFPCHVKSIQINHYFTRSENEWSEKLSRGRGDSGEHYSNDPAIRVNKYALVEDTLILENLKGMLSQTKTPQETWRKIISPNSTRLIELLHQAVRQITPVSIQKSDSLDVIPRPEMINYDDQRNWGLDLFEEGRLTEARKFFATQISLYPFDVMQYTNFSSICIKLGDFENAWKALAQAWRIAPNSLYVLLCMIDYFYIIGDFAQTEKTCLLAASIGDLEPVNIAYLALSQWKQGKQQAAKITAQPLLSNLAENDTQNPIFKEIQNILVKRSS